MTTAEVLERESRVLTGSVETIQIFDELERRRKLAAEGVTTPLSEQESIARLKARRQRA